MKTQPKKKQAPQYRIRILADIDSYEMGDAENEAETYALIEQHGVWGFITEQYTGSEWEHIDSCWGFIGSNYGTQHMLECAHESIPEKYRDSVEVVSE